MIIEKKIQHEIVEDDFLTIKSKVNKDKLSKLYSMLSGIYRNPIGAIVREYTSNAYDANIEADNFKNLPYSTLIKMYSWLTDPDKQELNLTEIQVNELKENLSKADKDSPIIVGIYSENDSNHFFVKDYGIGLSPQRIEHIYFNYLDSTKEDNDLEIGGYGIGCKSGLTYTHTLFINTVYNNIEYQYIMTKDSSGIPQGQLLSKREDCGLENGTTIKITTKDSDSHLFSKEIFRQLSYIPNVYYEIDPFKTGVYSPHKYSAIEFNNNEIYDFKIFKHAVKSPLSEMHISLNNITYSIDWSELGIRSINCPLALHFNTNELSPIPSRESILYTKESVDTILNRIEDVRKYFQKLYDDITSPTEDFLKYLKEYKNPVDVVTIPGTDTKIYIKDLFNDTFYNESNDIQLGLKIKYKPFVDNSITVDNKLDIFANYHISFRINHNSGKANDLRPSLERALINPGSFNIYNINEDDSSDHIKNYYLCDKEGTDNDIIVIKKLKKGFNLKAYKNILKLKWDDKSNWRNKINVFNQEIDKFINSNVIDNYSNVLVDPNWYKSYRAGNSKFSTKKVIRAKKEIIAQIIEYGVFRKKTLHLNKVENFRGLVIYSSYDDKELMNEIYKMLTRMKSFKSRTSSTGLLMFITSNTNNKTISEMKNAIPVNEFIESGHKPFIRFITSYSIINKFIQVSWVMDILKSFNKNLYLDIELLSLYIGNNYTYSSMDSNILKSLVSIADTHNYYDKDILFTMDKIIKYCEGIDLLRDVSVTDENEWFIGEYLLLKRKKVNEEYHLDRQTFYMKRLVENSKVKDFKSEYFIPYEEVIEETTN